METLLAFIIIGIVIPSLILPWILQTLSIVKVYLYDARGLEDLLRVISFFGLGVSLLALSWFYTRSIFQTQNTKKPGEKNENTSIYGGITSCIPSSIRGQDGP